MYLIQFSGLFEWILAFLNKTELRLVIAGLRRADGNWSVVDRTAGGEIFTSSHEFRDEVMRMCLHAGYSAFWYMRYDVGSKHGVNKQGVEFVARHSHWAVTYTDYARSAQPKLNIATECREKSQSYDEEVWCVNVPTREHRIMVRRVTMMRMVAGQQVVYEASRPLIVGNSRYYCIPLVVGRRIAQIVLFDTDGTLSARAGGTQQSYEQSGKYQQSSDLAQLRANWRPSDMLPKMYLDREIPGGKRQSNTGSATNAEVAAQSPLPQQQ